MTVRSSSAGLRSDGLYDRIMAERHCRMVDSAARRLASELNAFGCPIHRAELARRCGVEHWSRATLDEAVAAGERSGLLKALALGWVAPVDHLGAGASRPVAGVGNPWPIRLRGRRHAGRQDTH
ncbi:MAG: hypothetical protein ACRDKL_10330 [Solirubrobacteraceae bacterium]